MKTSHIRKTRNTLATIIVAVLFVSAYVANPSFFSTQNVQASVSDNVSGWAWSENIGWLSFNNTSDGSATTYGVNVDTTNRGTGGTGDFSGYAWSENIGWVSFNRLDTGTPPFAPFNGVTGPIAQIDWATGNVTGWARAMSGTVAGNGWDGWIKLSDASWTSGVKIDLVTNKFSGYAWGSDVIGWIDFAPAIMGANVVHLPPPVLLPDLTASATTLTPTTVIAGNSISLSATITNSGTASTGVSFPYFFQVSTTADGSSGVTDLPSATMTTKLAGAFGTASGSYFFGSAGNRWIRVCADKTDRNSVSVATGAVITESNETNNCGPTTGGSWTPVVVDPPAVTNPDLTAGAVSFTPTSGLTGTLKSTISSANAMSASGFKTLFQIATDATGANASALGTFTHPSSIASNGTADATFTKAFSSTGTYYIRACANKESAAVFSSVVESDYGNNCGPVSGPSWTTVAIPPAPCTDATAIWACNSSATCTTPPTQLTGQSGIEVGVCSDGTPAPSSPRACSTAVVTCTTPALPVCTINGTCDAGETILNCPSDCSGEVIEF